MAKYKEYQSEARRKRNIARAVLASMLVLILLVTLCLAYVASRMLTGKPLFDKVQPKPVTGISTSLSQSAALPPVDETTDLGGENGLNVQVNPRYWNTIGTVGQTVDNISIASDARMLALPANGRVNLDYFKTSLFVGDSLTQGFGIYDPLQYIATVAGYKGIGPREIIQNNVGKLQTGEDVPSWEYIAKQTPMNIYVGMGMNALVAMEDDAFLKYYGDFLDMLRAQFPNIPIYVQSVTPVTQSTNDRRPQLANERIRNINTQLALMAQVKNMYYVNLHEALADANGCLREEIVAGSDGIHLNNAGYELWTDYLTAHTAYNPYNVEFLTEPYNA